MNMKQFLHQLPQQFHLKGQHFWDLMHFSEIPKQYAIISQHKPLLVIDKPDSPLEFIGCCQPACRTTSSNNDKFDLNAIFAAEFSVENPMIPISHIVGTSQIDWNENPKTEATMGSTSPISFAHYFQFV